MSAASIVEPSLEVEPGMPRWEGVQGELFASDRPASGNTGGRWFRDEAGTSWFLKLDMHHPGLQTSAEVVCARLLACLGYRAPEIHKLVRGGLHISAARDVGEAVGTTLFDDLDVPAVRQLRVVAAYLKDWDRVAPSTTNNLVHADGRLTLIDFGGTLGARALGRHKPGPVTSEAIGCFEAATELPTIWDEYRLQTGPDHPWRRVEPDDLCAAVARLSRLSDEQIVLTVEAARYPTSADAIAMIEALRVRRDTLIDGLARPLDR